MTPSLNPIEETAQFRLKYANEQSRFFFIIGVLLGIVVCAIVAVFIL